MRTSMKKKKAHLQYNTWIIGTSVFIMSMLTFFAALVIIVDPLFHYHAPLPGLSYPLFNDRYQNDGISRNFIYDGIITGTSMTQNFKTSEAEVLWGGTFIKVCFPGGHYKEINENLMRAYAAKKDIKYVIRCLDSSYIVEDKDTYREDFNYPTYLTNNNPFDDVNYLFSKNFLSKVVDIFKNTFSNIPSTTFDEFGNWSSSATYGATQVLHGATYTPAQATGAQLTAEERDLIINNIQQNVTTLAAEHPETTFYLYFPPYSIVSWSSRSQLSQVDWFIEAEKVAIEELLKHPNIKLYSFNSNYELICNLDNYKDENHYGEWVNSQILKWMYNEEYLLTPDNYETYLSEIRTFYNNYDYESLYK